MQVKRKWWVEISDAVSNIEGLVKEYEYKFKDFRWLCPKFAEIEEDSRVKCRKVRGYGEI